MMDSQSLDELLPNFIALLRNGGSTSWSVTLPPGIDPIRQRLGLKKSPGMHVGASYALLLRGAHLGVLEVYEEPRVLIYTGRVPGIRSASREGTITLIYFAPDPNATQEGRFDRWKIPFP